MNTVSECQINLILYVLPLLLYMQSAVLRLHTTVPCLVRLPADPSRQARGSSSPTLPIPADACLHQQSWWRSLALTHLLTNPKYKWTRRDQLRNTSASSVHPRCGSSSRSGPGLSKPALSAGSEKLCARTASRVAGTRLARLPETGEAPIGKGEFQKIGS